MTDLTKQLIYEMYTTLVHLNEQRVDSELQEFLSHPEIPKNMTTVHVIDCIGRHEPINNVTIAKKMNLSKANITKISTKLFEEGYIKRFQLTDNKKEIYFRLTPKGKQVFDWHETLHQKKKEQFYNFLNRYAENEQQTVLKFLTDLVGQIKENTPQR